MHKNIERNKLLYKPVQPITRDLEHMLPYQQQAGFLAYRSSYIISFPVSQWIVFTMIMYSLNTVTRSYRIHTCFPFNWYHRYLLCISTCCYLFNSHTLLPFVEKFSHFPLQMRYLHNSTLSFYCQYKFSKRIPLKNLLKHLFIISVLILIYIFLIWLNHYPYL